TDALDAMDLVLLTRTVRGEQAQHFLQLPLSRRAADERVVVQCEQRPQPPQRLAAQRRTALDGRLVKASDADILRNPLDQHPRTDLYMLGQPAVGAEHVGVDDRRGGLARRMIRV